MTGLDPRLNAMRADLADARLRGRVEAADFASPRQMQVREPIVSVRRHPRFDAMQVTQALMGERVAVFAETEGWAWVQLAGDGYVGYVDGNALAAPGLPPSHRVAVPSTFLYPAPDLKAQPAIAVTLNAQVAVTGGDERFARLSCGRFVFAAHLAAAQSFEPDFVAVAERFLHVPYFWGGKSVQGLDCSGLVQIALQASGLQALRDSDMQESTLGEALPIDDPGALRRGDLVFWNGHVGIMRDAETLLHANGTHMMVVSERLAQASERIAARYGRITAFKRLQ